MKCRCLPHTISQLLPRLQDIGAFEHSTHRGHSGNQRAFEFSFGLLRYSFVYKLNLTLLLHFLHFFFFFFCHFYSQSYSFSPCCTLASFRPRSSSGSGGGSSFVNHAVHPRTEFGYSTQNRGRRYEISGLGASTQTVRHEHPSTALQTGLSPAGSRLSFWTCRCGPRRRRRRCR